MDAIYGHCLASNFGISSSWIEARPEELLKLSVLIIYDAHATHTNAVHDHVAMLGAMSGVVHHYLHCGVARSPDLDAYRAVVVHYSARLVTGVVPHQLIANLAAWEGKKILFVQDEYDVTETLRCAIARIGFDLVYTCVPEDRRDRIYPAERFAKTQFVSTMTGFAPDPVSDASLKPLAERPIWVGYRGRALPYWYGDLGQEKRLIAQQMRDACLAAGIPHDIAWTEDKRIYGNAWSAFLGSCRATLGTESGSNIFDDDGSIRSAFARYARDHPHADYASARAAVLGAREEEPLMNQVSPRIFEAIAAGTALVLYEGRYSGVVHSDRHFIALRKDGRNIADVLHQLGDTRALSDMAARAWDDVISSGHFGARRFMAEYDAALAKLGITASKIAAPPRAPITPKPLRYPYVSAPPLLGGLWRQLPAPMRQYLAPPIRRLVGGLRRSTREE